MVKGGILSMGEIELGWVGLGGMWWWHLTMGECVLIYHEEGKDERCYCFDHQRTTCTITIHRFVHVQFFSMFVSISFSVAVSPIKSIIRHSIMNITPPRSLPPRIRSHTPHRHQIPLLPLPRASIHSHLQSPSMVEPQV